MNPNLSNSLFKQEELPGMPPVPKLKKTSVTELRKSQKYDPGPDHPRFSAMAGQGVLDFEGRIGKFKPGGEAAGLLGKEIQRMEVDKYGFVADPTVPIGAYDSAHFASTFGYDKPRVFGPDEPLHTLQAARHTDKHAPGASVADLRHLPEEQWKTRPLVMRTEGRDVVIDGHHRIGAARRRGEGKVTVDYFDADEAKFSPRDWYKEQGYDDFEEEWPSNPTSSAFEPRSITPPTTGTRRQMIEQFDAQDTPSLKQRRQRLLAGKRGTLTGEQRTVL